MATNKLEVDFSALGSAATSIRRAVEDGTAQTERLDLDYGHPALSQAVRTFAADVDLAVDSDARHTGALATDLDQQVQEYRSVDAGSGDRLRGLAARLSAGSPAGQTPASTQLPFPPESR